MWDPLPNKNHLQGHFWIYVSLYAANNWEHVICKMNKDEHVITIIVNTTCIISMYLKIFSIYDTELANEYKSLVIQKWKKNYE